MLNGLTRLLALAVRDGRDDQSGQGLVEYGLVLVLVSIAAIAIMQPLGVSISDLFGTVTSVFP
jgi:Flp pilus assembly pilin Flp